MKRIAIVGAGQSGLQLAFTLLDHGYHVTLATNRDAGQTVFHLHFHVIPRKHGVPLKPPASIKEDPAILSDQALKLAGALRG